MPQCGLTDKSFCKDITSDSVSVVQRSTNSFCCATTQQQCIPAHRVPFLARLCLYRLPFKQKDRGIVPVPGQSRSLPAAVLGKQPIIRAKAR